MLRFTSSKEKRLWIWSFAVFVAIYATLFVGQPLLKLFRDQNLQAVIFVIVMILIAVTIGIHAIKKKPGKVEITIWLGIAAVYIMFFLRLGLPERSHLMEYSILAIFVHRALIERYNKESRILKPFLFAFALSVAIGIMDEYIQHFLPNRVFDLEDIIFNAVAVGMALGAALILAWIRNRKSKSKSKSKAKME